MHVNHFKGAEEHKQWLLQVDFSGLALCARTLVYRAGPANPPVLQATLEEAGFHFVYYGQDGK